MKLIKFTAFFFIFTLTFLISAQIKPASAANPCLASVNNQGQIYTCCDMTNIYSSTYNPANGFCGNTGTTCYPSQHPANFCSSRCVYLVGSANWTEVACNVTVPSPTPTRTPTPTPTSAVPTATSTPTPTSLMPTTTLTPTPILPTISASCACGITGALDVCDFSCPVYGFMGAGSGAAPPPFKCSLPSSILSSTPDTATKNNWCRRIVRRIGDADGDGAVDNTDYLYYVQVVNGGKVPPTINSDANGDGEVGLADRDIVVAQISQLPPNNCCTASQTGGGYQCIQNCGPPVAQSGVTITPPGYSCLDPTQAASRQQSGCPICLSSSTLISTPKGDVRVTELKKGMNVWSVDAKGNKISVPVLVVSSVYVGTTHRVFHLKMEDSRNLFVSPGHPLYTGTGVENLKAGDSYDGSTVKSINLVSYGDTKTYDLLPDSETGAYFANGILMGSTLKK